MEVESLRNLEDYIRIGHRTTEFFSQNDAETLFNTLLQFGDEGGYKVTPSKDKYKAKLLIPLNEEEQVEMTARIMKVNDATVCFELSKSGGDSLWFHDQFNRIREYFSDLDNATYTD